MLSNHDSIFTFISSHYFLFSVPLMYEYTTKCSIRTNVFNAQQSNLVPYFQVETFFIGIYYKRNTAKQPVDISFNERAVV